jgi:hypothetical protein
VRPRSDFFLQPLEPRTLRSSALDAPVPAGPRDADPASSSSLHAPQQAFDQQVTELRSALAEMANRMQQLQQIIDHDKAA